MGVTIYYCDNCSQCLHSDFFPRCNNDDCERDERLCEQCIEPFTKCIKCKELYCVKCIKHDKRCEYCHNEFYKTKKGKDIFEIKDCRECTKEDNKIKEKEKIKKIILIRKNLLEI